MTEEGRPYPFLKAGEQVLQMQEHTAVNRLLRLILRRLSRC
ncbi:MAG: hypothetical protein R3E31_07700 [Chloroflexota bacterium]